MAEAVNEGLLDKLKTAIRTSTAPAKARAAGDWFKEKVRQASASARMRAVTPNQLLRRQPEDDIMLGKMFFYKYDPKFAKKLPYWDMYPLVLSGTLVPSLYICLSMLLITFLQDFRINKLFFPLTFFNLELTALILSLTKGAVFLHFT